VHNYIIEKDRFSTGKNAAIIRVDATVQSGSKKMCKSPKIRGESPVQFINVPRIVL